jgi:D-tyrosyl-tRNA(Tyr) deacylase
VRAVVQRVSEARVEVEGELVGEIGQGLVAYIGVAAGDAEADSAWMAEKVAKLRIFMDADEKMNRSVLDEGGAVLAISQFTLLADARKGRRPSYSEAAPPDEARLLFDSFVAKLRLIVGRVETGRFQAVMKVAYVNEGPITILLDSKKLF